jgi:hypothetical protein
MTAPVFFCRVMCISPDMCILHANRPAPIGRLAVSMTPIWVNCGVLRMGENNTSRRSPPDVS